MHSLRPSGQVPAFTLALTLACLGTLRTGVIASTKFDGHPLLSPNTAESRSA